ncbi:MAG: bacillithiol system redox-active protein YtxJ [candidate division Zixibacteria bacterium]|nr:bacillithiol system redox-active protein YtxJ [candidate division Zixibacteria bacterium]
MIHDYKSKADYDTLIEQSQTNLVFLMKHSSICPISSMANKEFLSFIEDKPTTLGWQVLVREDRPLSLDIAERSGIKHQSPQIIVFQKGKPVWDCSHGQITQINLSNTLKQLMA